MADATATDEEVAEARERVEAKRAALREQHRQAGSDLKERQNAIDLAQLNAEEARLEAELAAGNPLPPPVPPTPRPTVPVPAADQEGDD